MANTKKLSTTTTTKSGDVIASNYDLTSQILLRLPPTSVSNLKLACKQWHSISSDVYFITNHLLRHPPLLSGFYLRYFCIPKASSHEYIALKPIKNNDTPSRFKDALNSLDLQIVQSCNGLLLCYSHVGYYICNPTTLQRKFIPLPKKWLVFGHFFVNLAFDPNKSVHYKVICVRKFQGKQQRYQIEVYSSETGLWRASGEPFIEALDIDFKHGVFCKGAIHWLKSNSSCLYFDLDKQCLKSTPEPPRNYQFDISEREFLGQCNGCLFLVVRRHLPNFTLFQMEDDYTGWFMKYVIDLEVLATKFPTMARNFCNTSVFCPIYECNVLCFAANLRGNGENEEVNLVLATPGEIVYFNPCTKVAKKITHLIVSPYDENSWFRDFSVHEYFESICPV